MTRTWLAPLALFAAWLWSAAAAAEEPATAAAPRVVLVFRRGDPRGLRLSAELASIGVDVVAAHDRRRNARRAGVADVATATLSADGRRVEIRLGPRADPRARPDLVISAEGSDELVSLRLAEELRVALGPFATPRRAPAPRAPDGDAARAADPAPPGAPDPAPSAPAQTPRPRDPLAPPAPRRATPRASSEPRSPEALTVAAPVAIESRDPVGPPQVVARAPLPWGSGVGLDAVIAPWGVGLDLLVTSFFEPLSFLRFEPFLEVPLLPTTANGSEGDADLWAGVLGARVNGNLPLHPRVVAFAGLGMGGVWLRAVGRPAPGYVGATEDAVSAVATAQLGLRLRVGEHLALVPHASAKVGIPPIDVIFDGRDVATWGLPIVGAGVSAELELPLTGTAGAR